MIILDVVDAYQNISPEKNKHKIMISVPANQFNNRDTSDTRYKMIRFIAYFSKFN